MVGCAGLLVGIWFLNGCLEVFAFTVKESQDYFAV
jgi:hypothetical protein